MGAEIKEALDEVRAMIDNCQVFELGPKAVCGSYECCQGCKDILGEEKYNKLLSRPKR